MKIATLREQKKNEFRVAITPDMVKRYVEKGCSVSIESGAGTLSSMSDEAYEAAGANISAEQSAVLAGANLLLCVNAPEQPVVDLLPDGISVLGMLAPYNSADAQKSFNAKNITSFALELLPRISRAQSMDVLSSQSNLAGYRAVIEAVSAFNKVVPMMMTAAGTVPPAKALILGAGVAGLQAIATARRLGAVVSAFDVRPVVKEQVQSLGGKFIEVAAEDDAETSGGYAKEMSDDYKQKQSALIHETLKKQDMVISTALIPGKPAPTLITEDMVKDMKPGSVIVDMAAANGGNCPLTKADKKITKYGVTIIGYTDLASLTSVDASALYARNLWNFVQTLLLDDKGGLEIKWDDDLIKGTCLTREGKTVHEQFSKAKSA